MGWWCVWNGLRAPLYWERPGTLEAGHGARPDVVNGGHDFWRARKGRIETRPNRLGIEKRRKGLGFALVGTDAGEGSD